MRFSKQILFTAIIAAALIGFCTVEARAAAPVNDGFSAAQTLSGLSGSVTGTNVDATKQAGEPTHAWNRGGSSVWYKYVATGNGVLTVDTLNSSFDSLLAVYTGTTLNNLLLVAANDDVQTATLISGSSQVVFGIQTGMTYYIVVDGNRSAAGIVEEDDFTLNFAVTDAPANDTFGVALSASSLSGAPNFRYHTATNMGASKQFGEPNHAGNTGGKSIWFRLNVFSTGHRSVTFTLEGRSVANPATTVPSAIAIYKGDSVNALTPVASTVAYYGQIGRLVVLVEPNQDYYIAVDGLDGGAGVTPANFLIGFGATKNRKAPDLDRDGAADLSVYRPANGTWYTLESSTGTVRGFQWGANGDRPLFNHFDGDDKSDYSVYRPDAQVWHGYRTLDNTYSPFSWGNENDIPLTINQLNGGFIRGYAVAFQPASGIWNIRSSPQPIAFQFGQNGDIPLTIDVDGDGTDEVAVFRPSNGTWYVADSRTGAPIRSQQFGSNGDTPVPADFDGDGKIDLAVFRPSNHTWYILQTTNGQVRTVDFGFSTDIPQPADYAGDGFDDIAVFRPSNGTWYYRKSLSSGMVTVPFGLGTDKPVSSPVQ